MQPLRLSKQERKILGKVAKKSAKAGLKLVRGLDRRRRRRRRRRRARRAARDELVEAPVAKAINIRTHNNQSHRVVTHREFLGDISGSVDFAVNSYQINPGLPATFPWLWATSGRYEHYRFKRLSFEYKPQAPTSATGAFIMAYDYNVDNPAPTSKQQMLSYHGAARCQPWTLQSMSASHRGLNVRNDYLVRTGSVSDAKLYDTANFYLATIGQADTSSIGELWVDYEVEFYTPQSNQQYPSGWIRSDYTATGIDIINGDYFTVDSNTSGGSPLEIVESSFYNEAYSLRASFSGVFFISVTVYSTDAAAGNFVAPNPPFRFPDGGDYAWYDSTGSTSWKYEVTQGGGAGTEAMTFYTAVKLDVGQHVVLGEAGIVAPAPTSGDIDVVISLMSDGMGHPSSTDITEDTVRRVLRALHATSVKQSPATSEFQVVQDPLTPRYGGIAGVPRTNLPKR